MKKFNLKHNWKTISTSLLLLLGGIGLTSMTTHTASAHTINHSNTMRMAKRHRSHKFNHHSKTLNRKSPLVRRRMHKMHHQVFTGHGAVRMHMMNTNKRAKHNHRYNINHVRKHTSRKSVNRTNRMRVMNLNNRKHHVRHTKKSRNEAIADSMDSTQAKQFRNSRMGRLMTSKLGAPYVWGGNGPHVFDCSGFTKFIFKHGAHIYLTRTAPDQYYKSHPVSKKNALPGDLVFFGNSKRSIGHVGIYIGKSNGKYMMQDSQLRGNIIEPIYAPWWHVVAYGRVKGFNLNHYLSQQNHAHKVNLNANNNVQSNVNSNN